MVTKIVKKIKFEGMQDELKAKICFHLTQTPVYI